MAARGEGSVKTRWIRAFATATAFSLVAGAIALGSTGGAPNGRPVRALAAGSGTGATTGVAAGGAAATPVVGGPSTRTVRMRCPRSRWDQWITCPG